MAANKSLHIVMYPWFAYGHMIPFLHLSNKLAENGHTVTYILPPKAITRLQNLNQNPNQITFQTITVPQVDGLPVGAENVTDIPDITLHTHLATAFDRTRPEFESIVESIKPDVILYDVAYWVPEVAAKVEAKSVAYSVVSAASVSLSKSMTDKMGTPTKPLTEEERKKKFAQYPHLIQLYGPFGEGITMYDRLTGMLSKGDAVACRTCREIEGKYCQYLSTQYNKKVLLTGPVLPEPDVGATLDAPWAEWLTQFKPGSVLFCAFGSQFFLEKDQFQEIVLGLEMTKLPFLMAVQPPKGCATVEEAFPEGFAERLKNRGAVTSKWVQQPVILTHPSVGCFVNHCAFGTMWEALLSEKQLVMIPQLGDQILNTKMLADELKVGVEVERGDGGWVSKESLCKAIKSVMDEDSEIGASIKKNHENLRITLASKDLMANYMDSFIKDLQALVG
ncbi:UDP-glycosyltransferase 79B2-like [Silene latifolia]|uniref:UDP-glycosyltransferase 79B2-like n=1 Tax=Silene latifolia TaxID=37657 RepID=UPI003D786387